MSVRIRFKPTKTNQLIIVTDSRRAVASTYLKKLGYYSKHPDQYGFKKLYIRRKDLIYWLSVGAKPTESVLKVLEKSCILDTEIISKLI